jgi:hypothetical protein
MPLIVALHIPVVFSSKTAEDRLFQTMHQVHFIRIKYFPLLLCALLTVGHVLHHHIANGPTISIKIESWAQLLLDLQ